MNILEKIKIFFFGKPLVLTNKVEKLELKGIEKKTKAEIENLGRKIGVELDKRLTKTKLIQQLKRENKKL